MTDSLKRYFLVGFGILVIFTVVVMAVFAGHLQVEDPNLIDLTKSFAEPSWDSPFGRDQNGRDIYSRILHGSRVSLTVAISVVFISVFLGLLIGSAAGYLGGLADGLIMRFIDILFAFPGFLLALSIVAVLGPSINNLIFAMCITGWAGYARLVRGEVMHLKEREYVIGAVALGASTSRVVIFHIWPNLVGPIVVQATFGMAGTILAESSLSFLGLGVPADVPTWGAMLNSGREYLLESPQLSIFPGLFIIFLVLGFNLFGDGLRDLLDPKKQF